MERRHFAHFIAVVDAQSISAAARRLHLSQPAVSQSIRELERSMRTPLFVRGKRLTLTPAGRALVGPARQTLRSFDNARAAVESVESLHTGRLDIAVVHGIAVDALGPPIVSFRRRFPDVAVRVLHAPFGPDGFELLRRGEAELLVTDHPAPYPRHIAFPLAISPELYAVFAPDATDVPEADPIQLTDLVRFRLLLNVPEKSANQIEFVAQLAAAHLPMPPVAVQTDHREMMLPLLLAGTGVALLPEPEARLAEKLGAQLRLVDMEPTRAGTCFHREDPLSPAARAFVSLLDAD
ncbi:LysR family transcriptional regulator [Jongsikchunia kroppenstedtii]|uniref:LysR family transcriptional regulator n=1 Tax=Jongsikchunia kroppenstedtii TaxID=1121721 RepID=UPI00036AE0F0|nr:LysR family transcriptional regulator [Jongsikchunia kroppenstedtii]